MNPADYDYYEGFDASKHYQQLMFRSGKGLQSRELNDLQKQMSHQVKGIADVLLTDGDIVSGGDVVVDKYLPDATNTMVHCGLSDVYLDGQVRSIPEQDVNIPVRGDVTIGVWLTFKVVTEQEDRQLRDPAKGAHNYDEAGAARLKVTGTWGLSSEEPDTPAQSGLERVRFYPVHHIIDGVLVVKQPPPQLDSVTQALARYDRESNGGSYLVEGMRVNHRADTPTHQLFTIEEGKAHIHGFEIAFNTSRQVSFPYNPDIRHVTTEAQPFNANAPQDIEISTNYGPVSEFRTIEVLVERHKQMTKSIPEPDQNIDVLNESRVQHIAAVKSDELEYKKDTDYIVSGTQIRWLKDRGPKVGTTFTVTYHAYKSIVSKIKKLESGFSFGQGVLDEGEQFVPNSSIDVSYDWQSPRMDLLVLTPEGEVKRIEGNSAIHSPDTPAAPANHLLLARILQRWGASGPDIDNVAIHAVGMQELSIMQRQIEELYSLLAIERLKNETSTQAPTSIYGVFVDPFFDDEMRDQGIAQTATITDDTLVMPVEVSVDSLTVNDDIHTLDYELEDVLVQTLQTGEMKVNPYQAFDPIPAKVTLTPSVDHWTVTNQAWANPITRHFSRGSGWLSRTHRTSRDELLSRTTQQAEFLRQTQVTFEVSGFDNNEQLESLEFDGIEIINEVGTQ